MARLSSSVPSTNPTMHRARLTIWLSHTVKRDVPKRHRNVAPLLASIQLSTSIRNRVSAQLAETPVPSQVEKPVSPMIRAMISERRISASSPSDSLPSRSRE